MRRWIIRPITEALARMWSWAIRQLAVAVAAELRPVGSSPLPVDQPSVALHGCRIRTVIYRNGTEITQHSACAGPHDVDQLWTPDARVIKDTAH